MVANTQYIKRKHELGFSLIEVLVSLALFGIVMTMSVGTLFVIIDANSKAQTIETLVNNVSMTLDGMTRELRTGYNYYCADSINNGDLTDAAQPGNCDKESILVFSESGTGLTQGKGSRRIAYRLNSTTNRIERHLGTSGANAWQPMTPSAVEITGFYVSVRNALSSSDAGGDNRSPAVVIYVSGNAGDIPLLDTSFNLQTFVTQQQLDI